MEYLFNDVLEIKNGKNQKLVENPEGLYPIYGSGGIIGYADKYICEANTVIIGRKGSINNPIYVSEPFWNVDTAFGLSPKQDLLLPRYLFYFCKNYNFEKLNKTVTIPSLTKADLLKIQIDLPSIDEQKKIVDELIKVETIINLRNYQVQQLDDLIKARFVEMFGDPQINPFGWDIVNISEVVGGKVSNGFFAKRDDYADDGNVSILGVANIVNRMYSKVDELPRTTADYKDIEKFGVKYGDMLFCRSSLVAEGIGKASIIPEDVKENILFECHVIRLPLDLSKCVPEFMQTLSTMDFFRNQVIAQSKTATMTTIGQDGILKTDIILPPIDRQREFYDFINQIDKSKLLSGCRLFHSWAPENRDKPKHVGVPRRRTKDLRGVRRQHAPHGPAGFSCNKS